MTSLAMRLPHRQTPKHRNIRCLGPAPDGGQRVYGSIAEATYAQDLTLRLKAGQIAAWEAQVNIRLTVDGAPLRPFGAHRDSFYRADFIVTYPDGSREVVDVKGYSNDADPTTRLYRLKLALLQRMHPDWTITIAPTRR